MMGAGLPDWLLPLVLAPAVGSLAGVLIERLPAGRPVLVARSACNTCGRRLTAAELVPVLSYLWLRGRCRCRAATIPPFLLAVELAAVLVPVSALLAGQHGALLWAGCLLGWGLLTLAWIDAAALRLPDGLTLPLIPVGLAITWGLAPWALTGHAVAAIAGYLALRTLAWVWRLCRGREGIGAGDAKLLAVAGAWAGLFVLPDILLGAALGGLTIALALRLAGRKVSAATALPFGPPLALAIWCAWLIVGPASP